MAKIASCFASYGLRNIVTKTCNFEAASSRSAPKTTTNRRAVIANESAVLTSFRLGIKKETLLSERQTKDAIFSDVYDTKIHKLQ